MPKQLKEIKSFNLGTILNLSEKDIPQEAAAFSLNVDPLSENGILNSIKTDKLYFISNEKHSYIESPISWDLQGNDKKDRVFISDISVFNSKQSSYIGFVGTKGIKEKCIADTIVPHFTRIIGYGNPGTLTTTSITIDEGTAVTAGTTSKTFNVDGTVGTLANIEDKLLNKEVYFSNGKYIGYCTSVTRAGSTDGTVVFSGGTKEASIDDEVLYTKGSAIKFIPSSNIELYDTEFTVLTDTIAITDSTISNFASTGFTNGEATITISGAIADGEYFNIITPDGKDIRYEFDTSGSPDTGSAISTTNVCIQINGMSGSNTNMATQIKNAIESSRGDDGRVSITQVSGKLTLTFEQTPINSYLREGSYISLKDLSETSGASTVYEIMKIISINSDSSTIQVERGCFGTLPVKYLTTKQYFIYGQMHTIDNLQINHNKGYCYLSSWSDYSGNHLGGNSSFLRYCNSTDEKEKYGGKITTSTSNHTISFANDDDNNGYIKISTSGATDFPTKEGDYVTIYHS